MYLKQLKALTQNAFKTIKCIDWCWPLRIL